MEPELPLRDIHLPAPVGGWPPAPGWWLLLVGVPALLLLLVWLWRWLRRKTVKKLALQELEAIARSDADGREKVQRLAILLRRACLSVYPREQVAGLVGKEWLAFLDRASAGRGKDFSAGVGRLLIEAPYRREFQADLDALFVLCRAWIKGLQKPGKAKTRTSTRRRDKRSHTDRPIPEAIEKAAPQAQDTPPAGQADPRRFARPPTDGGDSQP